MPHMEIKDASREKNRENCVSLFSLSLFIYNIMRKNELSRFVELQVVCFGFSFPNQLLHVAELRALKGRRLFKSEAVGWRVGWRPREQKNMYTREGYDHCLSLMTLMMSGFRFPSTVKTSRK
jgi:hypothetical protein